MIPHRSLSRLLLPVGLVVVVFLAGVYYVVGSTLLDGILGGAEAEKATPVDPGVLLAQGKQRPPQEAALSPEDQLVRQELKRLLESGNITLNEYMAMTKALKAKPILDDTGTATVEAAPASAVTPADAMTKSAAPSPVQAGH